MMHVRVKVLITLTVRETVIVASIADFDGAVGWDVRVTWQATRGDLQ